MSGAAQPIDRRAFLNQCRGAVERQLAKELEPLLEALPGQLDELGRQSRDRDERDQYSQASAKLSRDREAYFAAFRKEYSDVFEVYAKALQGAAPPVGTPGRDELAAMKTNILENEVAVGKLAARFKEHADAELTELSARVAAMFKRGALGDGDNPLGPLPIARAVSPPRAAPAGGPTRCGALAASRSRARSGSKRSSPATGRSGPRRSRHESANHEPLNQL